MLDGLGLFEGVFPSMEEHTDSDEKKMLRQAGRFGAVGLEIGIAVIIGIVGGQFLDNRLNTEPVFFWVGFGLGLGAAAKAVFDAVKSIKRTLSDDGKQASDKD